MIYSIWVFVGYDTVIYLAGLGNIPKEMGEAAEVDGATGWQVFRYITFPITFSDNLFSDAYLHHWNVQGLQPYLDPASGCGSQHNRHLQRGYLSRNSLKSCVMDTLRQWLLFFLPSFLY